MGKSTKTHRAEDLRQGTLLDVPAVEVPAVPQVMRFERGDRSTLYFGNRRLDEHLNAVGKPWAVRLAELLDGMDWTAFEGNYKPGGRPPLHPSRAVGLIIYGAMLSQASLRQMEGLAARDLGALWVTAGLIPDFTTLMRFMQRHQVLLSEDFFAKTAWLITKKLKLKRGDLAIDGTIVQAVTSTASAIKRAAVDEAVVRATEDGDAAQVERLKVAADVIDARQQARDAAGKDGEVQVSPYEPEAVLQPQKNSKDFKLSYKPVIATHESGLIIGQAISPSSETDCVMPLLMQHEAIFGAAPQRLLADAGFSTLSIIGYCVDTELDALIPSGAMGTPRKRKDGLFIATDFSVGAGGIPVCPAGSRMRHKYTSKDAAGRRFTTYRGAGCATCPLKERCTKKKQRNLKLYEGHEMRRVMDEVLTQPQARRAYGRRAAIVETSFAQLRRAGLVRFRRRGVTGARLELAIAAMGLNFRLLLWRKGGFFVLLLAVRRHGEWCVAGLAAEVG